MDEALRRRFAVAHLRAELAAKGLDLSYANVQAQEHAGRVQVADDGTVTNAEAVATLVTEIGASADPKWRASEADFYTEMRRAAAERRARERGDAQPIKDPYYASIRKAAQKDHTPSGPSVEQRLGMTTED